VHLAAALPEPALGDSRFVEHLRAVLSFQVLTNQARGSRQTLSGGDS